MIEGMQEQLQEEAVAIQLPRDYDEYFGAQGINEVIRTLLQHTIAAHGEEIAAHQEAAARHEALVERLQAKLAEAEEVSMEQERQHDDLRRELHEALEERAQAEQKRDNAVRIAEEAQEGQRKAEAETSRLKAENASLRTQIDELEDSLRRYKTPAKPSFGGITLTDNLPTLSEDELRARRKREETERLNRQLSEKFGGAVKPLDVPPLPSAERAPESVDEPATDETIAEQLERVAEAAAADADTFQVVQADTGATAAQAGAGEVVSYAAVKDWQEVIENRLAALESWRRRVNYYHNNGRWPAENGGL